MTAIRTTIITAVAAASLLAFAAPASAQVDVGVSIGYPGGYGIAQPVQPFYGAAPVYVAPAPVYVPRPYDHPRDEGRGWREREERAAEWHYRHDNRHAYQQGFLPDYQRGYGHDDHNDHNWRSDRNDRNDHSDRNDGRDHRYWEQGGGHR